MITDSEDRSMIAELEQIIQAEEDKPVAERDADLIDECIREIAELKGVRSDFSDEEIGKITDKLVREEKSRNRKRFIRLAAGIAAAFVIVSGVTACAINPALKNWILQIVSLPNGSTVNEGKITYINQGITKEYSNITEIITSEDLGIYYPSILPDEIRICYVEHFVSEYNIFSFVFSDNSLHYTVEFEYESKREGEILYELNAGELHFDVYIDGEQYIDISESDNARYIIEYDDIDSIISIIGGLKNIS